MRLHASKFKLGFSLLICVAFAIGGAMITYGLYTNPSDNLEPRVLLMKVLGPVAVPILLICAGMAFMQLIDKRPVLEVDENGISSRSQLSRFQMSWEEIAQAYVNERQVNLTTKIYSLVLVPRDPNGALMKFPAKARKRMQNNLNTYRGFPIHLNQLPGDPKQIGQAVAEYARQQIIAHPIAPPTVG